MNLAQLKKLIAKREGYPLEFKATTGELKEGLQTICAFLNGKGGKVLFGVKDDATITGQQVSEKTLREIAEATQKFEPMPQIDVQRIPVKSGLEVIALGVEENSDHAPFLYDGRAWERVKNTTRQMKQTRYDQLRQERSHSKRRWENQEAEDTTLKDIDREEVFRMVENARAVGRLSGPPEKDFKRILERLGVYKNGKILRAAVVLFGQKFLPDSRNAN